MLGWGLGLGFRVGMRVPALRPTPPRGVARGGDLLSVEVRVRARVRVQVGAGALVRGLGLGLGVGLGLVMGRI